MNDPFYKLYKASQDMLDAISLADCRGFDNFLQDYMSETIANLNRFDKSDISYYERWLKEKNESQ